MHHHQDCSPAHQHLNLHPQKSMIKLEDVLKDEEKETNMGLKQILILQQSHPHI